MLPHSSRRRRATALAAGLTLAVAAAGCGSGSGDAAPSDPSAPVASAAAPADLTPVKSFLLDHTTQLRNEVRGLRENAQALRALAAEAGFDGPKLLATRREDVARLVREGQARFARANPAYEQMEGVVAGVPELADFDVSIDAGGDASDPENAVPFSIETADGRTFRQPGNFNYLAETALFGTEPKWAAKGVRPDLDGDGEVEFGEALPDVRFHLASMEAFEKTVEELDAAAKAWKPTLQDALTALVVMTPTMSEYFEAWKSSRFVAGEKSTEKAFVVASRLQDIEDILGGLRTVYAGVRPSIASADPAQAEQTGRALADLEAFAADLRRQEAGGRRFTAQDADTQGGEAQDRAEAIAGQISQAAGRLNVPLET